MSKELDICVHIPKSAGITWRGLLIDKYGPDRVFGSDVRSGQLSSMEAQGFKSDNSQRSVRHNLGVMTPAPIAQLALAIRNKKIGQAPVDALPQARAVIGHFNVDAFNNVPVAANADYYTVIRNPFDRMVSHYRYLNQLQKIMPKMRHWGETHDVNRPFVEFALDEKTQNYQAQYAGTNLARYAVVGVFYDLQKFFQDAGLVDGAESVSHLNRTTWTGLVEGIGDPGFQREFEDFHALDYELYNQALSQNGL